MAYSNLPNWPLLLFGVIEPALLVWAYITVLMSPYRYFADQAPNHPISIGQFSPQALGVTLQMGNVLLLLAAMAVICCWTRHTEISFWYLVAAAFADIGHIYASYKAVGPEYFWNPAGWNDMIAGSVGASAFLNINRWLTVFGVFGRMQASVGKKSKKL